MIATRGPRGRGIPALPLDMPTLADSLTEAARLTPDRLWSTVTPARLCIATRTGEDAGTAVLARMPTGSVVSFMLPNWHEAAVVYLAATWPGWS